MQSVVYTLLNYINCAQRVDTNTEIAKCLLKNIRRLSRLSLEQTADLCLVSVSTLNRFFREIGFVNFSTFRKLMKNHELPFDVNSLIDAHDDCGNYIEKMIQSLHQVEGIESQEFLKIARMMVDADHIYLMGYGDYHYQAGYFQNVMLYHGKLLEIMQIAPEHVEENDLVLITSLSGGYVRKMMPELSNMKCRKVLITREKQDLNLSFDTEIHMGNWDDQNLNKYLILRVYEKIISSYYFYKSGQKLTSKD